MKLSPDFVRSLITMVHDAMAIPWNIDTEPGSSLEEYVATEPDFTKAAFEVSRSEPPNEWACEPNDLRPASADANFPVSTCRISHTYATPRGQQPCVRSVIQCLRTVNFARPSLE